MPYNKSDLRRLLEESDINLIDPISIPESLIEFNSAPVATLGNFSAIIGRAKSKKTYFLTYLMAQAFKSTTKKINITRPKGKSGVVLFDTEQSSTRTQKNINTLGKMCSDSEIDLKIKNLRKHQPSLRAELIEQYLEDNHEDICLVVLDGVKDLVNSINNEEQATYIVSKLLQWTDVYNVHIIVVLHQNKADSNARGHLGTEIVNKAESVIEVMKDQHNKDISHIKCVFARDKEFEPLTLLIKPDGIPELIEDRKVFKSTQDKYDDSDLVQTILTDIFSEYPSLTYGSLKSQLKQHCIKNSLSHHDKKLVAIIAENKQNGNLTTKKGAKNTTIYQSIL